MHACMRASPGWRPPAAPLALAAAAPPAAGLRLRPRAAPPPRRLLRLAAAAAQDAAAARAVRPARHVPRLARQPHVQPVLLRVRMRDARVSWNI